MLLTAFARLLGADVFLCSSKGSFTSPSPACTIGVVADSYLSIVEWCTANDLDLCLRFPRMPLLCGPFPLAPDYCLLGDWLKEETLLRPRASSTGATSKAAA